MGINITNIAQSHDEAQYFAELAQRGTFRSILTAAGWTATNVGTGGSSHGEVLQCYTGTTANSSALRYIYLYNVDCGSSGAYGYIDWDLPLQLLFRVARRITESQTVARIQLKEVNTIGALAALGVGIRMDNLAITGESYGSSLGTVDLSTSLVTSTSVLCVIKHNPTPVTVTFATGSVGAAPVIRGTQSTAANVPSGNGTAIAVLAVSIANGATGGTNAFIEVGPIWLWQTT